MSQPNINDYNSLPTTSYRSFVNKIEDTIKHINGLALKDSEREPLLRKALLRLLEINPDSIVESKVNATD